MPTPTSSEFSPTLQNRYEQAFWSLTPAEVDRLRKFGEQVTFCAGSRLFSSGSAPPGMFIILSGHLSVSQRDGMDHVTPITEQGVGDFIAEVGQLSGGNALVDVIADDDVEALLITPEKLRALLVAEASLGERITRALILRRVSLLEAQAGGPVLIGEKSSQAVVRLQSFLTRNGQPHRLLDPQVDREAEDLISRLAVPPCDLPLAVCPNGSLLRNPSDAEMAASLGMGAVGKANDAVYDVVVVGAGPAGLATAVYGASEGLSIAVLDRRAYGGQAGASARIENYFGFPTGISGVALTSRAFVQAQKFGARMIIPATVVTLDRDRPEGELRLHLEDRTVLRARAVVVATGAAYRRPNIPNLAEFEGRGVWYWASPLEAQMCLDAEAIVVGGGNSAGQAAVFLSEYATNVRMLVRGTGLKATMSSYLVDRIEASPNIQVLPNSEITSLTADGSGSLASVEYSNVKSKTSTRLDVRNVFLFVGADPATAWLASSGIALDANGFVVSGGQDVNVHKALESSVAGVFAVGDVRSGSAKRVGAAIGEGAQVVAALHHYLASITVRA